MMDVLLKIDWMMADAVRTRCHCQFLSYVAISLCAPGYMELVPTAVVMMLMLLHV